MWSHLPFFFFLLAGYYLNENRGHFNKFVPLYVLLVWGVQFCSIKKEELFARKSFASLKALSGGLLFFAVLQAIRPQVIYAEAGTAQALFRALQAVLVLVFYALYRESQKAMPTEGPALGISRVGIAYALSFLSQVLVLVISPQPHIDVFVSNTAGVDFFLQGLNPYQQHYADIYQGAYDYQPGFLYFPGTLYCLAPFRWLLGDIRYAFIAANALTVWGLWKLGRAAGRSARETHLWNLLWLNFPVTYFVLEQAWTDTLLIPLGIWILWWVEQRRIAWASVLMGFLFSVKQYAFVVCWVAWLRVWKQGGWRRALGSAVIALVSIGICLGPFLLWDAESLLFYTVKNQSNPAPRMDALNMTAFWGRIFHWVPSPRMTNFFGVVGVVSGTIWALSRWGRSLSGAFMALFVAYGWAFLWGKWAFCNYHYLHLSFLLAYIVAHDLGEKNRRRHAGL